MHSTHRVKSLRVEVGGGTFGYVPVALHLAERSACIGVRSSCYSSERSALPNPAADGTFKDEVTRIARPIYAVRGGGERSPRTRLFLFAILPVRFGSGLARIGPVDADRHEALVRLECLGATFDHDERHVGMKHRHARQRSLYSL